MSINLFGLHFGIDIIILMVTVLLCAVLYIVNFLLLRKSNRDNMKSSRKDIVVVTIAMVILWVFVLFYSIYSLQK